MERVHDGSKAVTLSLVPLRVRLLNLSVEGVQIQPDVDTGIGEGLHAVIVVGRGINVVDANGVGANRLHEVRVELALLVVNERVVGNELVSDAFRLLVTAFA